MVKSQWNLKIDLQMERCSTYQTGIIEASLSAEKLVENDIKLSTIQTSLYKEQLTAKIISERVKSN